MVPALLNKPGVRERGLIESTCPVCARSGVIIFVTGEGEWEWEGL